MTSSTCRTTSRGTSRRCRCSTEPHSLLRLPRWRTGYEAAVGETARLSADKRELDVQEAEALNRLAELISHLPDRPEVTAEYFVPDDRKSGGAYVTVTGRVRHIVLPFKIVEGPFF